LWAEAVVTVTFPDPSLLRLGKVTEENRPEVLRIQQLKVLGALDAATNHLKTGFTLDHRNDNEFAKHEFKVTRTMGTAQDDGEVLVEVVTIGVTLWDFPSIDLLKSMINEFLASDQYQLARDIQLAIKITGSIGNMNVDGVLFNGKAARKPMPTWLTLENKAAVVRFFSVPEVAVMIADACRGKLVTCDKMNAGTAVSKRHNIGSMPITIDTAADVLPLVDIENLGAFYPWIERQDGLIGRLVCDLDMGKGFNSLLGPQAAWRSCCAISDAITRCGTGLGFPMPARVFSGSRGIHVIWDLDPMAFHLNEVPGSCSWKRWCCTRCTRK
jgi:hypothetical protein